MITTAIRPAIEKEIRKIIAEQLTDYDVETVRIEAREDATGDDAIFIDIRYRLVSTEFDPALNSSVRAAVIEHLFAHGETRFPYIRHHLAAGQRLKS
jgi:hypothetical protein